MKYSDFREAVGSPSIRACSATLGLIGDLVNAIKEVDTKDMVQLSKLVRDTAKSSFEMSKHIVGSFNDNGDKAMVSEVFYRMIEKIADGILEIKREKEKFEGANDDAPSVDDIKEMYGDDADTSDGK